MGIQERKEREKERRRQQIIIAGKRVFSEKGYNKATMEDIAKEAEVSPGTLYLYFKNKEELYASLSLRILQYLNIRVEHVINENHPHPEKKIHNLMEAMFDVYEFDPLIIINMFHLQSSESLKHLSHELLSEIKELSDKSIRSISKIFKEGLDNEIYENYPPNALADIFWSIFSGIVLWQASKKMIRKDGEESNHLKPILQTAFEIFERGIKKSDELVDESVSGSSLI